MPLQDKVPGYEKPGKLGYKPVPKNEFNPDDLVYEKRISELRKQGKDHQDVAVLHVLMDTLHGLMPSAEMQYKSFSTHTNASAVANLSNILRETISDIRAYEDFGKRGDLIADFVGTQYKNLLMAAVGDIFTAQKAVESKAQPLEKEMDRLRTTLAKRFSESEKIVRDRVTQLLHVKT